MTPTTLGLLALSLYIPFGVLFYGMSSVARRADTLDAKARAIAKQNLRRRRAERANARHAFAGWGLAVV
ncbi:hypothetical protein GT347_02710 [Xylophilus rhododendri]|uniref:Uncharacterized protein n=1 Tax=Xylophilus rhododendri TaxID=2697032 RepID=A0A857J1M8_9BURK|nr:hypothetical protein [Xylophilus rhododendri]QHI96991.1 hypothetical protein GT347_02710 [Xylophilus rhododendri]